MKALKLAIAQLRCNLFNKENNLDRILKTMVQARKQGAQWVLFPELYLTGYSLNEKVVDLAESIDGTSISKIRKCSQENQIGVIIGFPERDANHIYNSAVAIDQMGHILGIYRKTHLFSAEKQHFQPGAEIPIFEAPFGKFGLMITYDMEFPEVARILSLKGAKMIFILAANMVPYQPYQSVYLRSRAMENHVFIAAANKVGLENDTVFFGESEVIHPSGHSLYKSSNNEDLAIIDLYLKDTQSSKGLLDYLINRRSNLYREEGI